MYHVITRSLSCGERCKAEPAPPPPTRPPTTSSPLSIWLQGWPAVPPPAGAAPYPEIFQHLGVRVDPAHVLNHGPVWKFFSDWRTALPASFLMTLPCVSAAGACVPALSPSCRCRVLPSTCRWRPPPSAPLAPPPHPLPPAPSDPPAMRAACGCSTSCPASMSAWSCS